MHKRQEIRMAKLISSCTICPHTFCDFFLYFVDDRHFKIAKCARLFLPEMVQRNSGRILNVSSTASFMPGPLQAVYFATKAYVTYFSNALAEELHDTEVTVTNLMPGATETEFAKTSGMDKTNLFDNTVSAKSVAEDGYKGMLEGKLDVISGLSTSQKIMMKMIPFTPKRVILKQIRQMQEEK